MFLAARVRKALLHPIVDGRSIMPVEVIALIILGLLIVLILLAGLALLLVWAHGRSKSMPPPRPPMQEEPTRLSTPKLPLTHLPIVKGTAKIRRCPRSCRVVIVDPGATWKVFQKAIGCPSAFWRSPGSSPGRPGGAL